MKLFSYVVADDEGFAPNPFWGYCTLACCKPKIRASVKKGDWIVGIGSSKNVGKDKIIYVMRVDEVLSFEKYSTDKRFKNKIPSYGLKEERGDNIYFKKGNRWSLRNPKISYHDKENIESDIEKGKNVLVSEYYFYFGREAKKIPPKFREILKRGKDGKPGPGHKSNFKPELIKEFIDWIEKKYKKYKKGDPCDFHQKFGENETKKTNCHRRRGCGSTKNKEGLTLRKCNK